MGEEGYFPTGTDLLTTPDISISLIKITSLEKDD